MTPSRCLTWPVSVFQEAPRRVRTIVTNLSQAAALGACRDTSQSKTTKLLRHSGPAVVRWTTQRWSRAWCTRSGAAVRTGDPLTSSETRDSAPHHSPWESGAGTKPDTCSLETRERGFAAEGFRSLLFVPTNERTATPVSAAYRWGGDGKDPQQLIINKGYDWHGFRSEPLHKGWAGSPAFCCAKNLTGRRTIWARGGEEPQRIGKASASGEKAWGLARYVHLIFVDAAFVAVECVAICLKLVMNRDAGKLGVGASFLTRFSQPALPARSASGLARARGTPIMIALVGGGDR